MNDIIAGGQTEVNMWDSRSQQTHKRRREPLMMPFSCSVFMDGRLLMNFFSLFFTPFLSALSDVLCFSFELVNMSEEKQDNQHRRWVVAIVTKLFVPSAATDQHYGSCAVMMVSVLPLALPRYKLPTDGAAVHRVALLGVWGSRTVAWQRTVSWQVLSAVWPLQGETSVCFTLETQRAWLGQESKEEAEVSLTVKYGGEQLASYWRVDGHSDGVIPFTGGHVTVHL